MGQQLKEKKKKSVGGDDNMAVEIVDMTTSISPTKTSITQNKKNPKTKRKTSKQQSIEDQPPPIKQAKLKECKKESLKIQKATKEKEMSDKSTTKKKNSGKNKKGKFKTLFVGGLDTKVPRETITEFFSDHDIRIYEVRRKGGRRFCHVDLLNPDDIEKALSLNGKKIGGTRVKINCEKKHFDTKEIEIKSLTLFVKNIDTTVSKDALRDLFPDAVSIKYPKTMSGKNKGFAYIKMETKDKIKEYLMKKNLEIKGHKLVLDTVEIGARNSKILRVRNLNFETTKETVENIFDGSSSVKLCLNNIGKSLGTAIVTFETIEEAKKTQKEKNKMEVDGRNIIVTFIEAEEKPQVENNKKKYGKDGRWGRKKSSVYEKKKKPQNIVKKSDGKQKLFKKHHT